jgi:hypothetical protein
MVDVGGTGGDEIEVWRDRRSFRGQPACARSAIADLRPKYLDELLGVFKQAREAGFVVIPSMDAQGENGILDLPCMPGESTVRAWKTLAPHLANDPWGHARAVR